MNLITWIQNAFIKYWYLIGWRHTLEIIFFSALFYYLSVWLKQDKKNNLLPVFYAYCILAFISYALDLSSISQFLFMFAPVTIMLFITMHQNTLQKNYVTARNQSYDLSSDWVDELLRATLSAVNNHTPITCLIESEDALDSLVNSNIHFAAPLQKELLDIVMTSSSFDSEKMIWVTNLGNLKAINTSWTGTFDTVWVEKALHTDAAWKQDALLLTSKSDATVWHIDPKSRTFTIIRNSTVYTDIPIHEFKSQLVKHLYDNSVKKNEGVYHHEPVQKNREQQPSA
ncbi:hypothetical protein JW872_00280 [Candidatus Babeliales bacterium]|nr:hypothetical protein [Candidatus Babeliales bacterium]